MIRLFAAIAIPDEIAEGLVRVQEGLDGASWRPTEAFHITLRFAGEIDERTADDLDAELGVISAKPLTLTLEGVGSFQDGADIHAVWAGVAANPALRRMASRCESAARRAGLKPDKRRWLPHVTLAYLHRADPGRVAAWIQSHNLLKSPAFEVRSFGLYSSWLRDEGSMYRLERRYALSPPPRGEGAGGGGKSPPP
jgi:2'-5' RNA ligase